MPAAVGRPDAVTRRERHSVQERADPRDRGTSLIPHENTEDALVDFHSHVVPGVDDGAAQLDQSLRALDRFAEAGVRRIITTPHLNASVAGQKTELERNLDRKSVV